MSRPPDVAARIEHIVRHGLPCTLRLVVQPWGWACLEVEPGDGFTHLAGPAMLASFSDAGWFYHITLGNHIPLEVLAEVALRWDGARLVLPV